MGRKKRPFYRIVAVDSRRKRDGAYLEKIGFYHPLDDPATVNIDGEKALKWLRNGAQPSNTVLSLLRNEGVWYRFLLEKRKLPEDQIETMMVEWMAKKAGNQVKIEEPTAVEEVKEASDDEEKADEDVKEAAEAAPEKEAETKEAPKDEANAPAVDPEPAVEAKPEPKAEEKVEEPAADKKEEKKEE